MKEPFANRARRMPKARLQSVHLFLCRLIAAACLLAPAIAGGAHWPQFRGNQASGVAAGARLTTEWDTEKGPNIRWKTPIPGLAHSSPILWGDRVYLTTATRPGPAELKVGLYGDIGSASDQESHQWHLIAVEKASGKIVFDTVGHEGIPRVKRHPKATHCNSTPATDGQRIVAIFGSEGLFCFDLQGRLVWQKELGPMESGFFAVPAAQWGFGSSPVIHDGKVVVLCDVLTNSFLAAFQLEDGKEVWRTARNDVPTWGTPTVVKTPGGTQVLVNGWHHTGAYDFATGREIWKLDGGGDIPVPTPIVGQGLAYFTKAHGRFRPMIAVRLEAQGDITPAEVGTTNAHIRWAHPRQGNYMQTPILVGDHLYACLDNGVVTCFDAQTGAIRYSERMGDGLQGFTASPVSDGHTILFASETGNLFRLPADGTFRVLPPVAMKETILATPALSDGILYLRTRDHLVAIGR